MESQNVLTATGKCYIVIKCSAICVPLASTSGTRCFSLGQGNLEKFPCYSTTLQIRRSNFLELHQSSQRLTSLPEKSTGVG